MGDHDPTDPVCPANEVPRSGCLCLWLKAARAAERARLAAAVETDRDRYPKYATAPVHRMLTRVAAIIRGDT